MANFRQSITVADGAAVNGNFPSASGVQVDGGKYNVFIEGSFQGATLTLQLGMDSSSFVSLTEAFLPRRMWISGSPLPAMPMSGAWCPVLAALRRISMSRWCRYRLKGFGANDEENLSAHLTRDTLARVFQRLDIIAATVRADSTEITVDSTLVTVDGLIRE